MPRTIPLMDIQTRFVYDYDLTPKETQECQQILTEIFTEYPKNRTFYKQISFLHLLAYRDMTLVGHLSLIYRAISYDTGHFPIIGVVDMVVREEFRNKGIASRMLSEVESFTRSKNIPFLLLFADNHSLYIKNGFENKSNICRWFMIDDVNLKSTGIDNRSLSDCLMVKQLSQQPWPDGTIDLLGYVF